jgi:hypothetical protein
MQKLTLLQKLKLLRFANKIASNDRVYFKLFNFISGKEGINYGN